MTISEFAEQSARNYLRTVLLVDDQLFPPTPTVPSGLQSADLSALQSIPDTATQEDPSENIGNQSPDLSAENGMSATEPTDSPTPEDEFSPQVIVEGFAKQGIVCGLYQPNTSDFSNGTAPQTMVDLCDHADVFILDWKLKDSESKSPVPYLLSQLLRQDESFGTPKPIRFCAIYTDRPLNSVVLDLNNDIVRHFAPESVVQDDSVRRFQLRGLTIQLYSKNNQREQPGAESSFVSSSDLAKRVIRDFASEYEGIMSATALKGIAEVRNNAKRILDKFPKGMDPALVLHAGLTIHDAAIARDITSLLADEAAAVLADKQTPSDDIYTLCKEYMERECPDVFLNSLKDTPNLVPQDVSSGDIRSFFVQVFNDKKLPKRTKVFEPCKKKLRLHRIDVNVLAALANLVRKKITPGAVYRFGSLAALFCQRTNYGNNKLLRFGTIVSISVLREGVSSIEYYLCLMPTCDSMRLPDTNKKTGEKEKHSFPFWRLEKVDSEHQGRNHGVMILDGEEYFPYCVKGKIRRNFALYEFYSEGGVVKFDESSCVKSCDGKMQFTWEAELKSAHSQRMAEYVSREFSRVGLIESEWLRLQVDR